LQELALFNYIQITGGNKYREGYQYKITNLEEDSGLNNGIENALRQTLENIKAEYGKTAGQTPLSNSQAIEKQTKKAKTTKK